MHSFTVVCSKIGFVISEHTLDWALPIGISFYTFHGLSYLIDLYKKRISPERNIIDFALFVSFFPLLVAGPIERATHLLPQLKAHRKFNLEYIVDGLRQILWGLVKKVVIADQCAVYVNLIFNHSNEYTGSTLLLGAILFSFQIYGDFSGYSDIALGTSRLFGIELLQNFSYPYFSRSIAEFWRRWHISLSTWFRDYVYIPLGGNKGTTILKVRNVFIIFLISGFWHGANYTFIVWGIFNALFVLPSMLYSSNHKVQNIVAQGHLFPSVNEFCKMISTFILISFSWIFFRANDMQHAVQYISSVFTENLFSLPQYNPVILYKCLLGFIILEWIGREHKYAIANLGQKWPRLMRWSVYYFFVFLICYFAGTKEQFIYFQF